MRWSTSILCLLCGTAAAAETYRWVDKNGVVHYSDQPTPGAERVDLQSAPNPGSVAPRNAPLPPPSTPASGPTYAACNFGSPGADEVFTNVRDVGASLNPLPSGLQPGHRVRVQVNGRPLAEWPVSATAHQLQNLPRGSYTLTAEVTDATGRTLCRSAPLTFHIRQPSALSPGAQSARQRSNSAPNTAPPAARPPAPRP